ncbi:MAG TPA: DsbA family protein [Candidatus Eremiobacteraceae bacterium]|nr:DsbA family protein [Candidatus Eremiobacteraceae bacterium]
MTKLALTYYMDLLSSWCFAAEGPLAKLRERLGDRLAYEWRIAYLFGGGPMGYTPQLGAWQYRRLESVSGVKVNPAWRDSSDDATWHADVAAEAARGLGITDDRVRLALTHAAFVDGKHLARREVAIEVAAAAAGVPAEALEREMGDARTIARLQESTASFKALGVEVRPAFVFTNDIGDKAVLSGLFRYESLASCADEMLAAADGYAAYGAAHPQPA